MSESYPFLHLSRRLGVSYSSVLALADDLDRLRSGMLRDMLMTPSMSSQHDVADAVLHERERRAHVLARRGVAAVPPRGACS